MKVLVVDGKKEDRRMVVEALLDLTNVIVYGAVGELRDALHVIATDAPDVIVTDADLPDGTGEELIAAARRHKPAPAIAVFTSEDSDEARARCADADLFIHKDSGLRELQHGVRDLLHARRVPRAERRDAFHLIGRMAAGVAHDLNNYLTVLAMTLDMIQRRETDRELWQNAKLALETATQMTRNLIAYARGGSPDPVPLDLGAIVRRTIGVVARLVPEGVLISLDLDDEVPPVMGVASELEQIVLNLVLNACDAMPKGGELRVGVRAGDEQVALIVEDSGLGIQDAPKFADGTLSPSTKKRHGAGLGLGIVRAAAERHRADLLMERRDEGGTAVTVSFPRILPAA